MQKSSEPITASKQFSRWRLLGVAVPLVFLITAVVAVWGFQGQYAKIAAEHWRDQLERAPEDRVEAVVAQVAELDELGISILASALGSGRECVAQAAKSQLLEMMERWRGLAARDASARLAKLADSLRRSLPQYGPSAKADAAALAQSILRRPLERAAVDSVQVIEACDEILRECGSSEKTPPKTVAIRGISDVARDGEAEQNAKVVSRLTALPGGGLPIDDSPDELSKIDGAAPLKAVENPPELQAPSEKRKPRDIRSKSPQDVKATAMAPNQGNDDRVFLAAPAIDLMKQLSSTDESTAKRAEKELQRRGMSLTEIDVARQAFHPDPLVRKSLVERLPKMTNMDATTWLLQLGGDSNADVRLAALTILATTSDPALVRQAISMAERDDEARVRRLAERINSSFR